MAGTNQYYTFAASSGANLEPLSGYLSDPLRTSGMQPGIAKSAVANRVWRQASVAAAGLAQFIANNGPNMLDDGDPNAFASNLNSAIVAVVGNATSPTGSYVPLNGSTAMTGALTTPGLYSTGNIAITVPSNTPGYVSINGTNVVYYDPSGSVGIYSASSKGIYFLSGATTLMSMLPTGGSVSVPTTFTAITATGSTSLQNLTASGTSTLQAVTATTISASGSVSAAGLNSTGGLNVSNGTTSVAAFTASGSTSLQGVTAQATTVSTLTVNSAAAIATGTITNAPERTANDNRIPTTASVIARGKSLGGESYYTSPPATMPLTDLGKAVRLGTSGASFALPNTNTGVLGGIDTFSITSQGGTNTVTSAISGQVMYSPTIGPVTSLPVPNGWWLEGFCDGVGGGWIVTRYGPDTGGARLQQYGAVTTVSGSLTTIDFTFSAGAFEELLLDARDLTVGATTSLAYAVQSAAGWSAAVGLFTIGSANTTQVELLIKGAQFDRSTAILNGFTSALSNPQAGAYGTNSGTAGGGVNRHDGGITGLRLTTTTPGSTPFTAGNARLLAR